MTDDAPNGKREKGFLERADDTILNGAFMGPWGGRLLIISALGAAAAAIPGANLFSAIGYWYGHGLEMAMSLPETGMGALSVIFNTAAIFVPFVLDTMIPGVGFALSGIFNSVATAAPVVLDAAMDLAMA